MAKAPYISRLLSEHDLDILGLSEHWLYPDSINFLSTVDTHYEVLAACDSTLDVCSTWRRGKGGVALLWRKHLSPSISKLNLDDDRILGISISSKSSRNLFIFMVYLPSTSLPNDYFMDYVQKLQDVYDAYSPAGDIIVMGDLNCEIRGNRYPCARDTVRERAIDNWLKSSALYSVVSDRVCDGPLYTFDPYDSGQNRSLIDHMVIPYSMEDQVTSCRVVDDDVDNLSDHLPVHLVINMQLLSTLPRTAPPPAKPCWKKAKREDLEAYSSSLSHLLHEIQTPVSAVGCTTEQIDSYLYSITRAIHEAARVSIPMTKFQKHLKPYWNSTLKQLHKSMKQKRRCWLEAGRPRGNQHQSYVAYKESKDKFRSTQRQCVAQEARSKYEHLDELADGDMNSFWASLKKLRSQGSSPTGCTQMKFGDNIVRDPKEISDGWANYFEKLYSPLESADFDQQHMSSVCNAYEQYLTKSRDNFSEELDSDILESEVSSACRSVKLGKACGADYVAPEHVKYGGAALWKHLTRLFNLFHSKGYMPGSLKVGKIVTLIKDKKKPVYDPNNYRGITLLSTLYKLFEKVILARFLSWIRSNNVDFPDPCQFAYQKRLSCINLSMTLQECVAHNIERGSKVYACFFDTSKAFDVVWHKGLFTKLFELGVNGKLWRTVIGMYSDMSSYVQASCVPSRRFPVRQSVRQGGVLSPWLYLLYIDGLLKELRSANLGAHIDNIYCGVLAQADDVVVLALSPAELQKMINICYNYTRKWRYKVNVQKTKVMVFGETTVTHRKLKIQRSWLIGNSQIEEVDSYKHVGVILNASFNNKDIVANACQKARGSFLSIVGLGGRGGGLNPLSSVKLYKRMVLPSALYGSELWTNFTEGQLHQLDVMQRFCLKVCQGLTRSTRTDMAHSLLGIPRISAFIERSTLQFWRRLCLLNNNTLCKKVFCQRLSQYIFAGRQKSSGIIGRFFDIADSLQLVDTLVEYFESEAIPAKDSWSKRVTEALLQREKVAYNTRVIADPDFSRFARVHPDCFVPSILWVAAQQIPNSLGVFYNSVTLLTTPSENVDFLCDGCGQLSEDKLEHRVVSCPVHTMHREAFWDFINNHCPIELAAHLNNLEDMVFVDTLLGAPLGVPQEDLYLCDKAYVIFLYRGAIFLNSIND